MAFQVSLSARARNDLDQIYQRIHAAASAEATAWFLELELLIQNLREHPDRGMMSYRNGRLREIFHGRKPHTYRVIYAVDRARQAVSIVHIRHGRRDAMRRRTRET